jgi:hypothetical protein
MRTSKPARAPENLHDCKFGISSYRRRPIFLPDFRHPTAQRTCLASPLSTASGRGGLGRSASKTSSGTPSRGLSATSPWEDPPASGRNSAKGSKDRGELHIALKSPGAPLRPATGSLTATQAKQLFFGRVVTMGAGLCKELQCFVGHWLGYRSGFGAGWGSETHVHDASRIPLLPARVRRCGQSRRLRVKSIDGFIRA